MIEAKLVDILLADTGVTAIVGSRIAPVVLRQDTAMPSVTYRRMPGGERTYSLTGRGGWTGVVVALLAWAADYATARALSEQMRDALDAYMSNGATDIQLATVVDGADEWIEEIGAFGCALDVTLHSVEV